MYQKNSTNNFGEITCSTLDYAYFAVGTSKGMIYIKNEKGTFVIPGDPGNRIIWLGFIHESRDLLCCSEKKIFMLAAQSQYSIQEITHPGKNERFTLCSADPQMLCALTNHRRIFVYTYHNTHISSFELQPNNKDVVKLHLLAFYQQIYLQYSDETIEILDLNSGKITALFSPKEESRIPGVLFQKISGGYSQGSLVSIVNQYNNTHRISVLELTYLDKDSIELWHYSILGEDVLNPKERHEKRPSTCPELVIVGSLKDFFLLREPCADEVLPEPDNEEHWSDREEALEEDSDNTSCPPNESLFDEYDEYEQACEPSEDDVLYVTDNALFLPDGHIRQSFYVPIPFEIADISSFSNVGEKTKQILVCGKDEMILITSRDRQRVESTHNLNPTHL
ncbi:hypothetical protein KKH43_06020 [Patescibacteria group bacterium]|nr:hypothetical protein [Patescibacteria group bacterium]